MFPLSISFTGYYIHHLNIIPTHRPTRNKERGLRVRRLHNHPIYFVDSMAGHRCDVCKQTIGSQFGYRSKMCGACKLGPVVSSLEIHVHVHRDV